MYIFEKCTSTLHFLCINDAGMQTVSNIVAKIGRDKIRASLGVGSAAVSNAITDNVMPPRWYVVIQQLCGEEHIDCPQDLFAFVEIMSDNSKAASE